MAPLVSKLIRRSFDAGQPTSDFSSQWKSPGDVFSVLLILGGEVVARALAQLVGSRLTPVAFSFGWVAYAVSAVVGAIGENKLMPLPDTSCSVINAKSRYERANTSWIIARIVRDYDKWKDEKVSEQLKNVLATKDKLNREKANNKTPGSGDRLQYPKKAGLCVSVYEAGEVQVGTPGYDFVYWLGFITTILQLGIASIPCGIFGDWSILLITVAGIILSFATGSLAQWKEEKWACRVKAEKHIILAKSSGCQHAILILGAGKGLDLEDLATVRDTDISASHGTSFVLTGLAAAWILLLITATGSKQNTWFLLAIGGIGILQNIVVAGKMRHPVAYGMPLKFIDVVGSTKVMETLFQIEEKYPYAGASMVHLFFCGGTLRDEEKKKWSELAKSAETRWREWKSPEQQPSSNSGNAQAPRMKPRRSLL